MNYDKVRSTCRVIRLVVGLALITAGVILENPWCYLGIIPIIASIANFCPLCIITKKCSIK
jgi:hypothetical protein